MLGGSTYVFDTLDLSGPAHVIREGPVKLYFKTAYRISGSARIDTSQNKPANRQLFLLPTCRTASWTGGMHYDEALPPPGMSRYAREISPVR